MGHIAKWGTLGYKYIRSGNELDRVDGIIVVENVDKVCHSNLIEVLKCIFLATRECLIC